MLKITSTYDHGSPQVCKGGVGCTICDIPPKYCPHFDTGYSKHDKKGNCILCSSCDMNTKYLPKTVYTQKTKLVEHLQSQHNTILSDNVLNFIFKSVHI